MRWLVLAVVACHAATPARPPTHLADRAVRGIARPVGVVELANATFVFEAAAITILRGDVTIAKVDTSTTAKPLTWRTAGTLAAPDGSGRWVVALADDGVLYHVTIEAQLESISDRLGLAGMWITTFASAGSTFAALAAGGSLAVTVDGKHMRLFDGTYASVLAVARGRVAFIAGSRVESWDVAGASARTFTVAAPIALAFTDAETAAPELAILTRTGLFVERAARLQPIALPEPAVAIAASHARVWLATASRTLYVVDGGTVARTDARPAQALHGSPSGDVWVAGEALTRYSLPRAVDPTWQASIRPIFDRVCAKCHLPGGSAALDLSSLAAWQDHHDDLVYRLVETRTMPPPGTDLDDADRRRLADWLSRSRTDRASTDR